MLILSPYAPHLGEEMWSMLGHKDTLAYEKFPSWVEELAKDDEVTIVGQINGKVRVKIDVPADIEKDEMEKLVMEHPRIVELLNGKEPFKVIAVPGKLVNIVVKG
ncbi:MAG: class I tRNA ligase family protein [Spirochaetota bacterium]